MMFIYIAYCNGADYDFKLLTKKENLQQSLLFAIWYHKVWMTCDNKSKGTM